MLFGPPRPPKPEDPGLAVRNYIASYFGIVPERITDELDLFVDLCFQKDLVTTKDLADEFFREYLYWDFDFLLDENFDFNRHFPEPDYPGYKRDRARGQLFGCMLLPFTPVILLLTFVALFLVWLGVPKRWFGFEGPPSDKLPPKVPREVLPDNYVPLTVGDIVRAVETGVLVVDYGDEPKSPPDA